MKRVMFWASLLAVGAAYELWAVGTNHDDLTLTAFTRDVFQTDTTAGRAVFTLAWGGLAAWFAHHILSGGKKK